MLPFQYVHIIRPENGIIISAMYVAIIDKVPKPKVSKSYIAYLTNVHTMKEYRNKGYGTELLSFIKKYLKEKGIIEALEEAGIQEGDTVHIYDLDFEFWK